MTRVVFFGTPAFAEPSLTALLHAATIDVVAVVTQPDRPRGRSHSTAVPPPVKTCALAAGVPVLQPERPRGDFLHTMRTLEPDLGVVVAYGHLLPPELLAIPRLGCANVHASLLPRWRGAAPIQWALLAGDVESGVTIMRVEHGLDTGAVWHERDCAISDRDTAGTLTDRLAHLGAEALLEALPPILAGVAPRPQDDVGATHAPKIHRDHARIRWDDAVHSTWGRIRAMDPAPGAWATLGPVEFKLFGATPVDGAEAVPGTITTTGERLVVATGSGGALAITDIQPAGKRRMSALDWLRGAALPAGARFT